MATRRIDDQFERNSFVAALPTDGKYLYKYCIANPQQRQCGVWEAPLGSISADCDIPIERIRELFKLFENMGKIKYFPELNKVWTKKFLVWQGANTDFVRAAIRQVKQDFKADPQFITEYINHYDSYGLWDAYDIDLGVCRAFNAAEKNAWHKWAKKTYPHLIACEICSSTERLVRHCPRHDYSKRDGCISVCLFCHPKVGEYEKKGKVEEIRSEHNG